MNVLYLSYDGVLDPLGQSQVVPYLEGLSALGHRFALLSFEKPARWERAPERDAMARRLESSGIEWHPLRYHKRVSPVATAFDLAAGLRQARRLVRRRSFDLVHARSYPPALLAWRLERSDPLPFIFDMRGLYAEERVDGGLWARDGLLYRGTKKLEARFLRDAAAVVTLTQASLATVEAMVADAGGQAPVDVIPTSVDLNRFRPAGPRSLPVTLSYVGSIGTWYLLDEMMAFAGSFLANVTDARLRFIVNEGADVVRNAAYRTGLPASSLDVLSVPYDKVPEALAGSWATFGFIRPAPSKIASAATKVSESLALGLPIAVNRDVGDGADIVERDGVGVVVDPFAPATFAAAAVRLRDLAAEPDVSTRCRQAAERYFDVRKAVAGYDRMYGAVRARAGV